VDEIPAGFTREGIIAGVQDMERFSFLFDGYTGERFIVFILDSKNTVRAVEVVSEGTVNASLAHPREIFRAAILGIGTSIILAHNHPSGSPDPSKEDTELTRQAVEAGKVLGIPVLDHIIFYKGGITSLRERGII
jgi:DNA repair protein RadC